MHEPRAPGHGHVYTIGHSNQSLESFLGLLKQHGIELLVDVRSHPYSGYSPHFDRESLRSVVQTAGIAYLFLGDELGGRPSGQEYYDDKGYVLYSRISQADFFQRGIERLKDAMARDKVVLMCSEEDPAVCHRHLLIGRVLKNTGVSIEHIRSDGRVQAEAEIAVEDRQPSLFEESEEDTWKSIRSVLRKNRPPNSSRS